MSFTRDRQGRLTMSLEPDERRVLSELLAQTVELLGAADDPGHDDPLAELVGIGTATHRPLDPALARLFPDAYLGDAAAAGDFRRYTESGLRRRKVDAAMTALAGLESEQPVRLDEGAAQAWLGALNDLRLVIGVRLGVQEDDDPAELVQGPDAEHHLLYWWLTGLQSDLLDAVAAPAG